MSSGAAPPPRSRIGQATCTSAASCACAASSSIVSPGLRTAPRVNLRTYELCAFLQRTIPESTRTRRKEESAGGLQAGLCTHAPVAVPLKTCGSANRGALPCTRLSGEVHLTAACHTPAACPSFLPRRCFTDGPARARHRNARQAQAPSWQYDGSKQHPSGRAAPARRHRCVQGSVRAAPVAPRQAPAAGRVGGRRRARDQPPQPRVRREAPKALREHAAPEQAARVSFSAGGWRGQRNSFGSGRQLGERGENACA